MKIYSFPAISSPRATVLILGTMPGVQSLAQNQYYAHNRNSFWKLICTLFEVPFTTDYQQKKELLVENNIALWDVLQVCERPGSLDSAIIKEIPNDFNQFLKAHREIRLICFNGQKAAAFFKKYVSFCNDYTLITLPSTSPANAGMTFEQKLNEWKAIRTI